MDDRELEARLKARLHTRFDDAPVPTELVSSVREGLSVQPRALRFDMRSRGTWLGWTAVAAAAVLVMTVLFGSRIAGPSAPRDTSSPSAASPATAVQEPLPTPTTERLFMVLAPGALPDKAVTTRAAEVLEARLRALGIGNFTSSAGNAITFQVPGDGPTDENIRAALGATGDIEFVPVPADAFASLQPVVGDALPTDLPALFGHEGIVSVERGTQQQGIPVIDIKLAPAAATAFGDYTAAHAGGYFAVVVDGRIALIPVINEPIRGGTLQISSGGAEIPGRPDTTFDVTAAILVGGRLPEAWQGARVPGIVTQRFAMGAALGQYPGAILVSADLDAEPIGDAWLAVWYVLVSRDDLANQQVPCPTKGPGASGTDCPTVGPTRRVVVNAEGGGVIRIEYPPA